MRRIRRPAVFLLAVLLFAAFDCGALFHLAEQSHNPSAAVSAQSAGTSAATPAGELHAADICSAAGLGRLPQRAPEPPPRTAVEPVADTGYDAAGSPTPRSGGPPGAPLFRAGRDTLTSICRWRV
ncbi:hypothetical protein [Streptomyces sp. NPDC017529]|uniref:hypothetical protein n=1 Tax=Streptomyces sp. NPDC017529 TaxID=3365000 RepID=UPI00379719F5